MTLPQPDQGPHLTPCPDPLCNVWPAASDLFFLGYCTHSQGVHHHLHTGLYRWPQTHPCAPIRSTCWMAVSPQTYQRHVGLKTDIHDVLLNLLILFIQVISWWYHHSFGHWDQELPGSYPHFVSSSLLWVRFIFKCFSLSASGPLPTPSVIHRRYI